MTVRRTSFKIVIKRIEQPFQHDVEQELGWICQSFGLFEPIDKDKLAFAIFRVLVQATEQGKLLTCPEIADKVNMSRGAVINHLNKLLLSGLIVREGRFYLARSRSMSRTIKEIQEEVNLIFRRMEETARELDQKFGLEIED
ncbi:MAG: winged helix-turn-helix transcriptional regulator [Candidatus Diapherotrites archaeon]|nr:winged helix-turn-helix transcriptional regulator [Candidatus Diapherotrites archaeon]